MNPLLTERNGRTYYGKHPINRYIFSVWLSDYNRENKLRIRPSTATAATFDAHLAAMKRGYWLKNSKVAA